MENLIRNNGAISVAEFMQEALFNPLHGYYRNQKPIGKKGDFITAPEISQTFGELIAAYFLNFILASSEKIAFVEMGAGQGSLLYDVILTMKKISAKLGREHEIKERVSFNIVEISETLTRIQQEKLATTGFEVKWFNSFADFRKNNSTQQIYFLANELFDCFPIHQFAKTDAGWQEKMVGLVDGELNFILENFNSTKHQMVQALVDSVTVEKNSAEENVEKTSTKKELETRGKLKKELLSEINENFSEEFSTHNIIFEYSFTAINFMEELSQALRMQGGIALIIDYGYEKLSFKNTLQAVKNHQYSDILKDVGKCDITALVNFSELQNCAKKLQLNTSLVTQREFLQSLGIEERRKVLLKNSADQNLVNLAIDRLISSAQMGDLFKCLLVW